MALDIITISFGFVNCYLLKTRTGFVLIDTGMSFLRGPLKKALKGAECESEDLKLIVITHADFDHTGNGVWLRKKYGVKIAVHRDEVEAVETGRMFLSRKTKFGLFTRLVMYLGGLLIYRRFKPDVIVSDGDDLLEYGLDGRIIHIPGHSTGSIGVLTGEGDFFCGDLMANNGRPKKNALVDDEAEMDASIERLKALNVKTVYPGHGRPFKMEEYSEND